jgi:hypothetical protein
MVLQYARGKCGPWHRRVSVSCFHLVVTFPFTLSPAGVYAVAVAREKIQDAQFWAARADVDAGKANHSLTTSDTSQLLILSPQGVGWAAASACPALSLAI